MGNRGIRIGTSDRFGRGRGEYSTPNSRILTLRTPKIRYPLLFGNSHFFCVCVCVLSLTLRSKNPKTFKVHAAVCSNTKQLSLMFLSTGSQLKP